MRGPAARDRHGREGHAQRFYRFKVFHGKDVVRRFKERGAAAKPRGDGLLPRGGVGEACILRKHGLYLLIYLRRDKKPGQFLKRPGLSGLAAEAEMRGPGGAEQGDRPAGEALRRGQHPRQRKLQHEIDAAAAGGLGAGELGIHRRFAALDVVAGHGADNSAILSKALTAHFNMVLMPEVKRIILPHYAYDVHSASLRVKNSCVFAYLY